MTTYGLWTESTTEWLNSGDDDDDDDNDDDDGERDGDDDGDDDDDDVAFLDHFMKGVEPLQLVQQAPNGTKRPLYMEPPSKKAHDRARLMVIWEPNGMSATSQQLVDCLRSRMVLVYAIMILGNKP